MCPSFQIAFHNPTPYPSLTSQEHHPPRSSPYFPLITWFHKVSLSFAKRQLHLQMRALLSVERLSTPKPLFLLSRHIVPILLSDVSSLGPHLPTGRWGVVLVKVESFFCLITLVRDQNVYKRGSFDVSRFYWLDGLPLREGLFFVHLVWTVFFFWFNCKGVSDIFLYILGRYFSPSY